MLARQIRALTAGRKTNGAHQYGASSQVRLSMTHCGIAKARESKLRRENRELGATIFAVLVPLLRVRSD